MPFFSFACLALPDSFINGLPNLSLSISTLVHSILWIALSPNAFNTASLADLQQLPQIGEKIAQRIIDFRKKNGKFRKIEEIMKVRGVGEKVFEKIKDLITVG